MTEPEAVVGRDDDLEQLEQRWETAAAGSPQAVLVEGVAGVGKTTLVRTFVSARAGVPVLWATGDELETDLPFGVAAQLLGESPAELAAHGDVLEVGSRMLQALSDRNVDGPVIIVVDDVGWADVPSMQAMAFALRRLQADPVLVLLTTRPELRPRLPGSLVQAVESRGRRLELQGLTRSALRRLAQQLGVAQLSGRALDRLAEHTSGNPLHARALLAELPSDALGVPESPLPAPRSYAELVVSRLSELEPAAREVVTAASVLGLQAPVPTIAAVACVEDPARALDAAAAAGLVEVGQGALELELRFTHPLVRAAIYHQLPLARRSELHLRAAATSDEHRAQLRHRAAAVTGHDDELSARLAELGHQDLARPAGAIAAAGWFRLAARLNPDGRAREDLVMRALQASLVAGDAAAAADLAGVLSTFAASPRKHHLEAAMSLAGGAFDRAAQLLTAAWEEVDPVQERQLAASIAGEMAVVTANTAALDDAVLWTKRAIELSEEDELVVSSPRVTLPVALAAAGRYDEARAAVEPIPAEGDGLDRSSLERLTGRGVLRLWTDDLDGAKQDLERVVRVARTANAFIPYSLGLCSLADAEFRLGEWDDALVHAELIASTTADLDQVFFLALPHAIASLPASNRGDWRTAHEHVDRSLEVAEANGDAASIMWSRTAEAVLATARGDHAGAVAAALACLSNPAVGAMREPGPRAWRVLGAEACAATGQVELGEQLLDGIDGDGRTFPTPALMIARARAALALAREEADVAGRWFDAAAEQLPRCRSPFERAQLHLAHGAHLRRHGERRRAVEQLESARRELVALDAVPWLERVDRELAASGQRTPNRSERRHVELTPQERAVAQLVAEGRRNREIGAELFISVKTVEYHLGNTYRKLGITNRTQLAARFNQVEVTRSVGVG